ncbi:MAG: NAD-dependent epimerase/dehydratase family protein [Sphingobacteriales bacterium]|nr:MAG: NAD-dependent epimerase/dehydratase family protein [Sphingobacteriales bacterium]
MEKQKILILGAGGQVGTELTITLRENLGNDAVVATDIKPAEGIFTNGPYEMLDVMDEKKILEVVQKHKPTQIYHLAALLSATAEKNPMFGWDLNMKSLLSVLNISRDNNIQKVYWPSSIAVFGPTTPRENTPQDTIMDPNTVYGISKLAGERWCEYYFQKYGLDVRSLRYPGLISYKTEPGGGTTDYAVHIFYEALKHNKYTCFLSENTPLPMLYMPDAIKATLELMEAPAENIKIRSSYNLGGVSFTPAQLAEEIKKHLPDFSINYEPDFRQKIADSWPGSIDDSRAKQDWNWKADYDTAAMVKDMLENIGKKIK